MKTKVMITGYMKEEAARYLVRILKEAGGCVAFSRFYDGSFPTRKSLRNAVRISQADARWLVPEVVLKSTIEDLQSLGYLEILLDTRKKLVNGQDDFRISLTTQGSQDFAAGKLPLFADKSSESLNHYPVRSNEPQRKPGTEPTRKIRASEVGIRLMRAVRLRSEEWRVRKDQFQRRYGALMEEAIAIRRLRTEQPDKLDPVRVDQVWKTAEALETSKSTS